MQKDFHWKLQLFSCAESQSDSELSFCTTQTRGKVGRLFYFIHMYIFSVSWVFILYRDSFFCLKKRLSWRRRQRRYYTFASIFPLVSIDFSFTLCQGKWTLRKKSFTKSQQKCFCRGVFSFMYHLLLFLHPIKQLHQLCDLDIPDAVSGSKYIVFLHTRYLNTLPNKSKVDQFFVLLSNNSKSSW